MKACLPTKLRFLPNRPIDNTIVVAQTTAIATTTPYITGTAFARQRTVLYLVNLQSNEPQLTIQNHNIIGRDETKGSPGFSSGDR